MITKIFAYLFYRLYVDVLDGIMLIIFFFVELDFLA